jgi:hypothetical protein
MSLYSLEEICKGCVFADWGKKPKERNPVMWNCKKDIEHLADSITGECDGKLIIEESKL